MGTSSDLRLVGSAAVLATLDTFFIDIEDKALDGCLPTPSRLRESMELVLRQSGFTVIPRNEFMADQVFIRVLGQEAIPNICALSVTAQWRSWVPVPVPYAGDMPGNDITMLRLEYEIGTRLLSGPKDVMQKQTETTVKEFGERLFLEFSRAHDRIKKDFPKILERKRKLQNAS